MSIVLSILALGFIIMIHEFGHFLFAKLFGIGVVEFSVGFGPRILSRVIGNTCFSLRCLPFGGSCMMLGEMPDDDPEKSQRLSQLSNAETGTMDIRQDKDVLTVDGRVYPISSQFIRKPAWQRFLVILAGPLFNFLLAFLISMIVVGYTGYDRPLITEAEPGLPAYEAGLRQADEICGISCGNQKTSILTAGELMLFLTENDDLIRAGKEVSIDYYDVNGIRRNTTLIPAYDSAQDRVRMGFTYQYAYTPCANLWELIRYSADNVGYTIRSTIASLRMIFSGKVGRDDVMGPVRMVTTIGSTVEEAEAYGKAAAVMTLLNLMILVSGSLGSMNLLPIPALDGGRLILLTAEMLLRKPLPKKAEAYINAIGMGLLFTLMILILFNDISILVFK